MTGPAGEPGSPGSPGDSGPVGPIGVPGKISILCTLENVYMINLNICCGGDSMN